MMTSYPPPNGGMDPRGTTSIQGGPMAGGRRKANQTGRPMTPTTPMYANTFRPRQNLPPLLGKGILPGEFTPQQQAALLQQQAALQQQRLQVNQPQPQVNQPQPQANPQQLRSMREHQMHQQAFAMQDAHSPSRNDSPTKSPPPRRTFPPFSTWSKERGDQQGSQEPQPLSNSKADPGERIQLLKVKATPRKGTLKRCLEPTISKDHSDKGNKRLKSKYIALQQRDKKNRTSEYLNPEVHYSSGLHRTKSTGHLPTPNVTIYNTTRINNESSPNLRTIPYQRSREPSADGRGRTRRMPKS